MEVDLRGDGRVLNMINIERMKFSKYQLKNLALRILRIYKNLCILMKYIPGRCGLLLFLA